MSDGDATLVHHPPQEERDERTDDRTDEARCGEVERPAEEQCAERPADERADDAEHHRRQPAHRVVAWHERARDKACDQAHDQEQDESHSVVLHLGAKSPHVTMHLACRTGPPATVWSSPWRSRPSHSGWPARCGGSSLANGIAVRRRSTYRAVRATRLCANACGIPTER